MTPKSRQSLGIAMLLIPLGALCAYGQTVFPIEVLKFFGILAVSIYVAIALAFIIEGFTTIE